MSKGKKSADDLSKIKDEFMVTVSKLMTMLNRGIKLTPLQRMAMPKMSDQSVEFVRKVIHYAEQNPELCPAYLNLEELKLNFKKTADRTEMLNALDQLREVLHDERTVLASDTFQSALAFYGTLKAAAKAKVPGTDAIVEDLRQRFAHGPRKPRKQNESVE